MRIGLIMGSIATLAAATGLGAGNSHAQSLFDSLFGSSEAPVRTRPAGLRDSRMPVYSYPSEDYDPATDPDPDLYAGGSYRTLCVRACDGFYWPISSLTTRSKFRRDADVCRASCGEEARLFYHAADGGEVSRMTDLAGRRYSEMPNAFLYRTKLVEGCSCKPEPWSEAERDRHRRYSASEGSDAPADPAETATPLLPERNAVSQSTNEDQPDADGPADTDVMPIARPPALPAPAPRGTRQSMLPASRVNDAARAR